ncbi:uncharacterized protein BT62DRAFT_902569 [Guyanagaster necrorhizus]|uniref:J domain-containing protein n=1 Tax=Guyanagaster necrorhizus TaxID=856835 RepID=A0A9P8AQ75_9AGAR|nr:uncharacterized protein BT62DRAFT_902569 [Guyanagaster necrorhizus MCA 3950]KAG7443541.1 hypothetical protein BT62DRAFT_902569 [Guyanagaster necrorhizus MCA 3950]
MHYQRLALLPQQLHIVIQARCASTSSSPFPFPPHPDPTPHQIFHLPYNASQQDIKARYYELVRQHHPDSLSCRDLPSSDRQARFQAIAHAYDTLRGKNLQTGTRRDWGEYADELQRRKRRWDRQQSARYNYANPPRYKWESNVDDRWKDNMILTIGVVSLVLGIAPSLLMLPFSIQKTRQKHLEAASDYSKVRTEAVEEGDERRQGMKRHIKEMKTEKDPTIDKPCVNA